MCKSCGGTCPYTDDRKKRDLKKLVAHSNHHSAAHIRAMYAMIMRGLTFREAHKQALQKVGM